MGAAGRLPRGGFLSLSRIGTLISQSRIEIDPHIEPQRRAFVLMHEVVHAILIHGQVDLGEDEESVVDVMALGFLAFLRDNPGLVAKIQAMWHG